MTFTLSDMERSAGEAWGPVGIGTVRVWADFNKKYFGGKLRPVPLVLTHTQPFGKRIAFCSYNSGGSRGRTITLNVSKDYSHHLTNNNTLLHEMIHQTLYEAGESAGHHS